MKTETIILLLLTHWVADFIFQTDKQAKGKSSSWVQLTAHVSTYALGLCAFGFLLFGTGREVMYWVLVNGLLHWCTDWVTSRINSKLYQKGEIHWFFVSVGFDQFIHYTTLILTFKHFIG